MDSTFLEQVALVKLRAGAAELGISLQEYLLLKIYMQNEQQGGK